MMNSIDVLKDKPTFRYYLVDTTRLVLSNYALQVYYDMVNAFDTSNKEVFEQQSTLFLDIILYQDSLLRSREEFFDGQVDCRCAYIGHHPADADLFKLNAMFDSFVLHGDEVILEELKIVSPE